MDALTTGQVAQRLNVTPKTVRSWIHTKRLPAINIAAHGDRPRYRIALTEYEAFLRNQAATEKATPDADPTWRERARKVGLR